MIESGQIDRARGALTGLAIGDALGMPTQTMTRIQIQETYGSISEFTAPIEDHPVAHGLQAAQVTDDTEQSLLLAELLVQSPHVFDETQWAHRLLAWEDDVKRRGVHDLLGPSSKLALENLLDGEAVDKTGIHGTTNGAAMRITPVGCSVSVEPLEVLVDCVERTCRITHNTGVAIASASAVAATVSAGIDGASFEEALGFALSAAREGLTRGNRDYQSDIVGQIQYALQIASDLPEQEAIPVLIEKVGTSVASEESIPTAFGIARLAQQDTWRAGLISANIGGDTDTIGAIACAIVGACGGSSRLPEPAIDQLLAVNDFDFDGIARALIGIRNKKISNPYALEKAI